MLKEHQRFFNIVFQMFDIFIIAAAWLISYPIRFVYITPWIPVRKGFPLYDEYAYLTFAIIIMWFVSFHLAGVYQARRTQTLWPEVKTLAKASTIAFSVFATLTFLSSAVMFSRGVMLVFFVVVNSLLLFERISLRLILRHLRKRGFNQRFALIVGDNEISQAFLERIKFHPELGLQVKGLVRIDGEQGSSPTGLPILGTSLDLTQTIKDHGIDQVFLALKAAERPHFDTLLASLAEQNVRVSVIPDIYQFVTIGCDVEEFEGMPLINLNHSPIIGWNRVAKRISDVVYATIALLIFSPLMALIAAAIKLFTPGPIIYRQERMGLDGKVFHMLKFRTMRIDAEGKTGAVWAKPNDDRVTWLGRLLRKTSLDELPQLINVIRGEMSCVGPRPERPQLVERFRHEIPKYMLRHKVKAGMTGWAQINGWRGDTSLEKRIEFDLYYITHWSLFFDLKIMFMTLFKGFISKNAY
ncbi:MAG: undecaprenyl-phosphate glucose phosphotransferase [Oligoflexia bacterium]|nr:undecaprenyl-phosphate glucose phosphotransferase [Oligoflexia bacterium]